MDTSEEANRTAPGPKESPWLRLTRPASALWTVAVVIISLGAAFVMANGLATNDRTGARDESLFRTGLVLYAALWLGLLVFVVGRFDTGHKWARLTVAGLAALGVLQAAPLLLPVYDGAEGVVASPVGCRGASAGHSAGGLAVLHAHGEPVLR